MVAHAVLQAPRSQVWHSIHRPVMAQAPPATVGAGASAAALNLGSHEARPRGQGRQGLDLHRQGVQVVRVEGHKAQGPLNNAAQRGQQGGGCSMGSMEGTHDW